MESSSLIGKVIQEVWTHTPGQVHPAWVSELTTPIAIWVAFIELGDGELISVYPCEVRVENQKYPSLGLTLQSCTRDSMRVVGPNGQPREPQPLAELTNVLPLAVLSAEESDPLGEGVVSEIKLAGEGARFVLFRHILPPMTLGISISSVPASN
jgi:hypothetical protein